MRKIAQPTKESVIELLSAFGWIDIRQEENPYMLSFKNEQNEKRINYYFTTGTITCQGEIFCSVYKNITLEGLEDKLQKTYA